jgi:3-deoxy-D-manno-octulosonate 8-phosphate phosphatase (KDO 8-P phosphatase)
VDGVLTDGKIILRADEDDIKGFDVKDGFGVAMARRAGFKTGIITGRTSRAVSRRAKELKIDILYQGRSEKKEAFEEILSDFNLSATQVVYVGDDVLDMPILSRVGLAVAPADGHRYVREKVDVITDSVGGNGVVRELVDRLLLERGQKEEIYSRYWSTPKT